MLVHCYANRVVVSFPCAMSLTSHCKFSETIELGRSDPGEAIPNIIYVICPTSIVRAPTSILIL